MFCTQCGQPIPTGVRFCTGCGALAPATPNDRVAEPLVSQPSGVAHSPSAKWVLLIAIAAVAALVAWLVVRSRAPEPIAQPIAPVTASTQPTPVEAAPTGDAIPVVSACGWPTGQVLSYGDQGQWVESVQQGLANLGYEGDPNSGPSILVVDGDYGEQTQIAVRKFQANGGLAVTGQFTDSDWESLVARLDNRGMKPTCS